MTVKKTIRTALAACMLLAAFTGSARAEHFSYVGDSTGKPTWDVDAAFNAPGTVVPYDVFDFHVDLDGTYKFLEAARFDSMIILYGGGFDAADPQHNLIRLNDDILTPNTSGFVTKLTAGIQYTLVVTGFNDSEFGAYSVSIGGPGHLIPGPIAAVPEPSTWLMLGAGLVAVGVARRRKAVG